MDGYDDNKNVKAGESKITKKIWAKTINSLPNQTSEWYSIPEGIVATKIDSITGEYSEYGNVCYFERGTEPNYVVNELVFPNKKD